MKDFTKDFQVLERCVYLNTAASGILSNELLEWRHEHDTEFAMGGSVFREKHKEHLERVRRTVGSFLNAREQAIALVPNFSFGFNALLEGLPKSQKVLLLARDYPSINWAVESREFDVCYTEINEHLEDNILNVVKKHKPDVFAFSWVQYLNGIMMSTDFLTELKSEYPDMLLIADGTQYLGTEKFDFTESPVDIMGASGYKWLLAGYGNGFFLVKDTAMERIVPKTIGFNSAEATYSRRLDVHFMKHFEPGHQDTLNFGSLEVSINYLQRLGLDWIGKRNRAISAYAKKKFAEMGLLEPSVIRRDYHGTIFNLKCERNVLQRLNENGIVCSWRDGGIRVSTHFYNSEEDIDTLLSLL